jgi:hypothetical protein
MTEISRRIAEVVDSSQRKLAQQGIVLPVKTPEGILVGDILIKNIGVLKYLYRNQELIYKEIHLNIAAIKMANILARSRLNIRVDEIYRADQEYGKWYTDSQVHKFNHDSSRKKLNHERADMLWSRYCESRDRALQAKKIVESLCAG